MFLNFCIILNFLYNKKLATTEGNILKSKATQQDNNTYFFMYKLT